MARFWPRLGASSQEISTGILEPRFLAGAQEYWTRVERKYGLPFVVWLPFLVPALSRFPGQSPARLAIFSAVGKMDRSVPVSAKTLRQPTGLSQVWSAAAQRLPKWRSLHPAQNLSVHLLGFFLKTCQMAQTATDQKALMVTHAVTFQSFRQLAIFCLACRVPIERSAQLTYCRRAEPVAYSCPKPKHIAQSYPWHRLLDTNLFPSWHLSCKALVQSLFSLLLALGCSYATSQKHHNLGSSKAHSTHLYLAPVFGDNQRCYVQTTISDRSQPAPPTDRPFALLAPGDLPPRAHLQLLRRAR